MRKVAVIMSVYKNDKLEYVKSAVESILQQSYSNFDFHIQADGYLDEAVVNYLHNLKDKRIFFRKRDENKGLAYSLNELIKVILTKDYEIIFRMDADDISLKQRFQRQIQFLENNKTIDCVGTWATEIDSKGNEFFKKKMPVTHKQCFNLFKKRDCLIHPSVAFRKSYFEKAGLYPEDTYFGEDTMMWAKGFVNECKFANIPEYLFIFRLDEDFFKRRRGWKHAKSIYMLRLKVNNLIGYPFSSNIYALMYATAKLMPTPILNLIYKVIR